MIYSEKKLAQLVIEYCSAFGIEHVVISPGSRNAPLTIGFTNHKDFKCYSIVDERCAAFFGLGIAQQTKKPAILICTSGSALLNYYPAIAEAFYSDIPLIVISADRPKHLIDIGDGQTIRQENVFQNHSLFNANLVDNSHLIKKNSDLLVQAIQTSINHSGPVHINVPFDEPLYKTRDTLLVSIPKSLRGVFNKDSEKINFDELAQIWNASERKMILVGSNYPDILLQKQLSELVSDKSVLVLTETTSNLHHPKFINSIDKIIFPLLKEEIERFQPEILVTLGGMIVSKKIKQVFRTHQPKYHWHVDYKSAMDTYHCLSHHYKVTPTYFFKELSKNIKQINSNYQQYWLSIRDRRNKDHQQYINSIEFSDLRVFYIILNSLPNNSNLQLGNSSIIRYAQLFNINTTLDVFCNRGTSGIDGSTSTAIGFAMVSKKRTLFITGDISFFYDSNALWNNYIKNDFRIILINNNGGGIFKFIPGPSSTNVLEYFDTPHHLTAKHLCKMYDIQYNAVTDEEQLNLELKSFYLESDLPKLLEVFTPNQLNDSILKKYFKNFKNAEN